MVILGQHVGGAICLDFVNTASQRRNGPFLDKLLSYNDLVEWAENREILNWEAAKLLSAMADKNPESAALVLERARALREAIYRVFLSRFIGTSTPADDLELISLAYNDAAAHRSLLPGADGSIDFEWSTDADLNRPVWPIAVSAASLLTSDEASRVKECATENCNWLFLDASKNRSRRWCEMSECGNRAKARRHYERKRG